VATLWGIALVVLFLVEATVCLRALRRRRGAGPGAPAQVYGRLALLAAAGLTVAAFAGSPTPGIAPANNVRYIIGVLVATPAVVASLWRLGSMAPPVGRPLRAVALLLVAGTLALGTAQAYRDAGQGAGEAGSRALIEALRRYGVSHIYSGYPDCYRLSFLSREQVVCAVLFGDAGTGLHPGFDRYLPYRTAVRNDPRVTYVFRSGDPRNAVLDSSGCRWQNRWDIAGYEIRQPGGPCLVP
jgi:hypothetical protein